MRAYQIGTVVLATGALVFGFQNCAKQGAIQSQTTTSADSTEMRKTMSDLQDQIHALSASDLSCAADLDCALLPVGAGHCGLPTFQVVGSVRNAARPRILELAREFKDVERNYLSSNQLVTTCGAPEYPAPTCVQNRCVIQNVR